MTLLCPATVPSPAVLFLMWVLNSEHDAEAPPFLVCPALSKPALQLASERHHFPSLCSRITLSEAHRDVLPAEHAVAQLSSLIGSTCFQWSGWFLTWFLHGCDLHLSHPYNHGHMLLGTSRSKKEKITVFREQCPSLSQLPPQQDRAGEFPLLLLKLSAFLWHDILPFVMHLPGWKSYFWAIKSPSPISSNMFNIKISGRPFLLWKYSNKFGV